MAGLNRSKGMPGQTKARKLPLPGSTNAPAMRSDPNAATRRTRIGATPGGVGSPTGPVLAAPIPNSMQPRQQTQRASIEMQGRAANQLQAGGLMPGAPTAKELSDRVIDFGGASFYDHANNPNQQANRDAMEQQFLRLNPTPWGPGAPASIFNQAYPGGAGQAIGTHPESQFRDAGYHNKLTGRGGGPAPAWGDIPVPPGMTDPNQISAYKMSFYEQAPDSQMAVPKADPNTPHPSQTGGLGNVQQRSNSVWDQGTYNPYAPQPGTTQPPATTAPPGTTPPPTTGPGGPVPNDGVQIPNNNFPTGPNGPVPNDGVPIPNNNFPPGATQTGDLRVDSTIRPRADLPDAPAPGQLSQGFDAPDTSYVPDGAVQRDVSTSALSDQGTVEGRIDSLLDPDHPLMQKVNAQANERFAGRGLLNSSMGAQGGLNAMLEQAVQIASQDAAAFNTHVLTNKDAINQQLSENAGFQQESDMVEQNYTSQWNMQQGGDQNQMEILDQGNEWATHQLQIQGEQQFEQLEASLDNALELGYMSEDNKLAIQKLATDGQIISQLSASTASIMGSVTQALIAGAEMRDISAQGRTNFMNTIIDWARPSIENAILVAGLNPADYDLDFLSPLSLTDPSGIPS